MNRMIALCLVIAAGCSHGSKTDATPTTPKGADMAVSTPELDKFHAALAPRWHADKGPARMKTTCDAVLELLADTDAIAQAPAPTTTDAGAWTQHTHDLTDAINALKTTCDAGDTFAFETAFSTVHAKYHVLIGEPEGTENAKRGGSTGEHPGM